MDEFDNNLDNFIIPKNRKQRMKEQRDNKQTNKIERNIECDVAVDNEFVENNIEGRGKYNWADGREYDG